jgi:shikimate kinase
MLPNFVLVGFMGCGKTTVGRRLAAITGHRFVDADELIVKDQGKSISTIFAESGEECFREIEERIIADLVGVAGIILSSGGGAILREANRASLKKIGIIIWLDRRPALRLYRHRTRRSGPQSPRTSHAPPGPPHLIAENIIPFRVSFFSKPR